MLLRQLVRIHKFTAKILRNSGSMTCIDHFLDNWMRHLWNMKFNKYTLDNKTLVLLLTLKCQLQVLKIGVKSVKQMEWEHQLMCPSINNTQVRNLINLITPQKKLIRCWFKKSVKKLYQEGLVESTVLRESSKSWMMTTQKHWINKNSGKQWKIIELHKTVKKLTKYSECLTEMETMK